MKNSNETVQLITSIKRHMLQYKIAIFPLCLLFSFFSTTAPTMAAEPAAPENLRIVSDPPPPPPPGPGDHTHFETEKQRLKDLGKLLLAADLRSDDEIDKYRYGKKPEHYDPNVAYDPVVDGAVFPIFPSAHEGVTQQLEMIWPGVTSGTIYIQYEVRFSDDWGTFDHSNKYFTNCKYVRVRQDGISGVTEDRVFDFQMRMSGAACRTGSKCPAGIPTVRGYPFNSPYDCRNDPFCYDYPSTGEDRQPGGDTAYDTNDDPFSASDHPAVFAYLPNRWIRETYAININEGTMKVWMSDEKTSPKVVLADPTDTSAPYDWYKLNPNEKFKGIDRIRFSPNASSRSEDDPNDNSTLYMWHRNLIVSKSPINLD